MVNKLIRTDLLFSVQVLELGVDDCDTDKIHQLRVVRTDFKPVEDIDGTPELRVK